jgi:hypothetical protein
MDIQDQKSNRLQATKLFLEINNGITDQVEQSLVIEYGEKLIYYALGTDKMTTYVYLHFRERIRFTISKNPFLDLFSNLSEIKVIKPIKEEQRKLFMQVVACEDFREYGDRDVNIQDIKKEARILRSHWFLFNILAVGELKKEKVEERILEKYGRSISYLCLSKNESLKELFKEIDIEDQCCYGIIKFRNAKQIQNYHNKIGSLFESKAYVVSVLHKDIRSLLTRLKMNQDYLEYGDSKIYVDHQKYINKDNVEECIRRLIQEGCSYMDLMAHDMEVVSRYAEVNEEKVQRMIYKTRLLKNGNFNVLDNFTIEKEQINTLINQLTNVLQNVKTTPQLENYNVGDENSGQ